MTMVQSETALDWWQRASLHRRRRRRRHHPPPVVPATDPTSAARNLWQGTSGIAYMDAAWRPTAWSSCDLPPPVVVLEGNVGKTWTLRSLAARFVVATRPSRFAVGEPTGNTTTTTTLPQVLILDSNHDFAPAQTPALAKVVRSTLLRQPSSLSSSSSSATAGSDLESEWQECLERIHIVSPGTTTEEDWMATLEVLRQHCRAAAETTTHSNTNDDDDDDEPHHSHASKDSALLVLWDGCPILKQSQYELWQSLSRWLDTCPQDMAVVLTTTTTPSHYNTIRSLPPWINGTTAASAPRRRLWHRIQLQRRSGKDCVAHVLLDPSSSSPSPPFSSSADTIDSMRDRAMSQTTFPFSLSLGGILS